MHSGEGKRALAFGWEIPLTVVVASAGHQNIPQNYSFFYLVILINLIVLIERLIERLIGRLIETHY